MHITTGIHCSHSRRKLAIIRSKRTIHKSALIRIRYRNPRSYERKNSVSLHTIRVEATIDQNLMNGNNIAVIAQVRTI